MSKCNPNQLNSTQPFPATLRAFYEVAGYKVSRTEGAGHFFFPSTGNEDLKGESSNGHQQQLCHLSAGIFTEVRQTKHLAPDKSGPTSRTIGPRGDTVQDSNQSPCITHHHFLHELITLSYILYCQLRHCWVY